MLYLRGESQGESWGRRSPFLQEGEGSLPERLNRRGTKCWSFRASVRRLSIAPQSGRVAGARARSRTGSIEVEKLRNFFPFQRTAVWF